MKIICFNLTVGSDICPCLFISINMKYRMSLQHAMGVMDHGSLFSFLLYYYVKHLIKMLNIRRSNDNSNKIEFELKVTPMKLTPPT